MCDTNAREAVSWDAFAPVWDEMVMLEHALALAIESQGFGDGSDPRHTARKAALMNEARVRIALERNTFAGFVEDLGAHRVTRACEYFGRWMPEKAAA